MKILVTGSNGYLAKGIITNLLNDGHQVICVDIKNDEFDSRAEYFSCDLFEISNPYEYFNQPEVLLHLAWRNGFDHQNLSHIDDLSKHFKFIQDVAKSGVKKICVLGSMHEIGFHEGSINENTICKPMNYYGVCKNTLRELVELLAKEYDFIYQWIRAYYIVDYSVRSNSIFSKIARAFINNEKYFPLNSGLNQYDFIEYDKFSFQVSSVVNQDRINGIINCCSGYPEQLGTRIEKFIRQYNIDIELKYNCFPDREYDSKAIWGDSGKIINILKNRESKESNEK